MAEYAIERNGELVREVKFVGEGLYRDKEIVVALFKTERSAQQVAMVLNGTCTVVKYDEYMAAKDIPLAA